MRKHIWYYQIDMTKLIWKLFNKKMITDEVALMLLDELSKNKKRYI